MSLGGDLLPVTSVMNLLRSVNNVVHDIEWFLPLFVSNIDFEFSFSFIYVQKKEGSGNGSYIICTSWREFISCISCHAISGQYYAATFTMNNLLEGLYVFDNSQ